MPGTGCGGWSAGNESAHRSRRGRERKTPERRGSLGPERRGGPLLDDNEACRKIAALTAIVQTMMHEVYCAHGTMDARESFDLQVEEDELLAMAIANELGEEELAHAFGWVEAAFGSNNDELSASPVLPHLRAGQRERARVALLALEEADHAHTLAVRMPDRPGVAPLGDEERVSMGEETFLGRIEIDVLHEHEGWSGFTTMAKPDPNERLDHLPEPWRKHAAKRLAELRVRIRATLERRRLESLE